MKTASLMHPARLADALLLAVLLALPGVATGQQVTVRNGDGPAVIDLGTYDRDIGIVLDRLEALVEDDRQATASGAPISDAKANALRRSVQRLVFRARTNGQSLDVVAERLQAVAGERFGTAIPGAFADAEGRLDARALMRGVVGQTRTATAEARDTDYMSAISREGAATTVGRDVAAAAPTAPAESAELETAEEVATRDATMNRIETAGGRRSIVVQPGDTLGSLARDVYGDMLQFRRIYEANRDVIANPNIISPGVRLILP